MMKARKHVWHSRFSEEYSVGKQTVPSSQPYSVLFGLHCRHKFLRSAEGWRSLRQKRLLGTWTWRIPFSTQIFSNFYFVDEKVEAQRGRPKTSLERRRSHVSRQYWSVLHSQRVSHYHSLSNPLRFSHFSPTYDIILFLCTRCQFFTQ